MFHGRNFYLQKIIIFPKIIRPLNIRHMNSTLCQMLSTLWFAITELTDFSFELTNTKPPENPEWTAGIKVNGKGNGKYDADFCLFMENWIAKKNMLQTGKLSKEKFDSWKSDMLAYYKDSRLDNEAD